MTKDEEELDQIRRQAQLKGKLGEKYFVFTKKYLQGYDAQRTGKGSDFAVRDIDENYEPTGPTTLWEIKTGPNAELSDLQKETKKKHKGHYKVKRYWNE
jgi:hypothetical protein